MRPRRLLWTSLLSCLLHAGAVVAVEHRSVPPPAPPPPVAPDRWTDGAIELEEAPANPSPAAPSPAAPPATEPELSTPPAVDKPSAPAVPPSPTAPPPSTTAPDAPALPPVAPPTAPPAKKPRKKKPKAPPATSSSAASSTADKPVAPAAPATSAAPASSAPASAAGAPGAPGTLGVPGPVTVRDLGLAFTRALAPAGQPDRAWGALPVGSAGVVELILEVDEEGKLRSVEPAKPGAPPQLAKLGKQAQALLRSGFFAIRGATPTAGRQVIRLSAELSDVPKEVDGGPVALSFSFENGKGKASFTQTSGRRVEIRVEVLRVETAAPPGGKKAP